MSRPVFTRQRIAVAGFGVAGAFAATLLARLGHDVHVFERAPRLAPVGAGLLLQPAGQAALARARLLAAILGSAEPITAVRAYTHTRRTLVHLPYPAATEATRPDGVRPHALGVHRADLFAVLHAAALAAGATLHLDTPIVSSAETPDAVTLTDARGQNHGPFDAVLAADGARSALRAAHFPVPTRSYAHGAAWAVGPCRAVRGHLLQVTRGTTHLAGLLPTGNDRCSLFWGLPVRNFPDCAPARGGDGGAIPRSQNGRPVNLPSLKLEILSLIPEAAEILDTVSSLDAFTFTTYTHASLSRWHTRRLCLLGDAAHASSPHLGQGVNLALLDAEALAHAVAGSAGKLDWPATFAHYERLRRPHQRYYSALTHFLTPFFQSDGHLRGVARNATLPLLPHVPFVRPLMLKTLTGPTDFP
jgi:2-polyprenyl-6-methoxyphenol hydroxylase-like FAD-dependent oxidoreductase